MNPIAYFLSLLSRIAAALGDEHRYDDLSETLTGIEPIPTDEVTVEGLSDDERAAVAAFAAIPADTRDDLRTALRDAANEDEVDTALVLEIADGIEGIGYVDDVLDEVATVEQEARDEALRRIAGRDETEIDDEVDATVVDSDEDEDEDGDDPGDGDDPIDSAPDGETVEELEPVLAAGAGRRALPRIGQIRNRVPAGRTPSQRASRGDDGIWRLATEVGDHRLGSRLSHDDFVDAVAQRLDDVQGGVSVGASKMRIGRIDLSSEYPEERTLTEDPVENGRRVAAAVAAMRRQSLAARNPVEAVRALTAAGGICAPPTPLYEIAQVGDDGRPVRAFLPSFNAARGGITFRRPRTPLDPADVDTDDTGVSIWTNANDQNPTDPATKPILVVDCTAPTTVSIEAVTKRIRFGNFMAQYDRESVEEMIHLQDVVWARVAEIELLRQIEAASVAQDAPAVRAGFARDYLNTLDLHMTERRYTFRMGENEVLDVMAPTWVHAAMRSDLVLEIPGSPEDRLATADAMIDRWFGVRGARVGFFRDSQGFDAQVAGQEIPAFPDQVTTFVFDTGHHLLLDGGRYDFGLQRGPALDDTNDAVTFGESMEAVASRGVFSTALTQDVCISGTTSGTADLACAS